MSEDLYENNSYEVLKRTACRRQKCMERLHAAKNGRQLKKKLLLRSTKSDVHLLNW